MQLLTGWKSANRRSITSFAPKRRLTGERSGELLEISMGPQHPSTHGVFRMDVVLDGERVVKLKPVFGYLHRNHEKIAESTTYLGSMPYTDRLDYFCSLTNNWAYALAVEKLAGLQVPERAEYIRVITAELTRLQNHTCLVGFLLQDMGAMGTPLMYAFREREKILDLFESLTGARMMCNYMRFGGCRCDLPAGLARAGASRSWTSSRAFLDEFEKLLTDNEILMARTQGVGVLSARARHQRQHHRPDAARQRGELRHPQGGPLRHLRPLRVPRAAGRARRCLRPLHDPRPGDARVAEDPPAGAARHSRRADHRSEGQAARLPAQAGRGLRPHRSAQRASWASTSSATARPIRTATASARRASST